MFDKTSLAQTLMILRPFSEMFPFSKWRNMWPELSEMNHYFWSLNLKHILRPRTRRSMFRSFGGSKSLETTSNQRSDCEHVQASYVQWVQTHLPVQHPVQLHICSRQLLQMSSECFSPVRPEEFCACLWNPLHIQHTARELGGENI